MEDFNRKAVFLDRDGTINRDRGHTHKIEDLEFLPGALEGLAKLRGMGFHLIVVANQAGIARGLYTEEHMHAFHAELACQAGLAGITFTAFYHCPHHPDFTGPCACRKPLPGMLFQAQRDYGVDFSQSVMIGDSGHDILAGKAVGAKTFLITDDPNVQTHADFKVKNILEVCEVLGTRNQ